MIKNFRATFKSFESGQTIDYGAKTKIMELFKDEYLCFGQEIINFRKLYISSVNLDLNEDKGLLKKLVVPWIQKTSEALLKDEVDPKPICLLIKNNHKHSISENDIKVGNCECNISFKWKSVQSIFDTNICFLISVPIPSLEILVFGLMDDFDKIKLLDWITGVNTTNFDIPEKYLSNIIILLHLIKV